MTEPKQTLEALLTYTGRYVGTGHEDLICGAHNEKGIEYTVTPTDKFNLILAAAKEQGRQAGITETFSAATAAMDEATQKLTDKVSDSLKETEGR